MLIVQDYLHEYCEAIVPRPEKLADVNVYYPHFNYPLQIAAAWGHLYLVRYLLDYGANLRQRYQRGNVAYRQKQYIRHDSKGSALLAAVFEGCRHPPRPLRTAASTIHLG
ncbi:uncharacterized protein F4807DRAFT_427855 [Annulohypoxylon truncatum]|uniref:uncharacterized protein n=1 Tax=Annulohypoxylon truncatum TaxID=327061 RepID=UPI00200831F2|nr:uncharacterized protein F4807DRAFT_427855 [Annulohypoxylon truncatum]KAI1209284.1 hypothetical protein F4807DRAFT_427855 [Annulohypoxylon truncatum]